jgi:hypothetical protein
LSLEQEFPNLKYSAGLLGFGSDVLGFDTVRSTDHNWGPRLLLFLNAEDHTELTERISLVLSEKLPLTLRGYPTNFSLDTHQAGIHHMQALEQGPVKHFVQFFTVQSFFEGYVGVSTYQPHQKLEVADWLSVPQQKLLVATAGQVFHNGLGELNPIREKLSYYPHEIWLWLLAAQWKRLSQEEAFVGRATEVGDELGSQVVAARLVRDIMNLGFLLERQYAPYTKWFGTAFAKLRCASQLQPILRKVLLAPDWQERQQWLAQAYEIMAQLHNALGLTKPLDTSVRFYYGRPYLVIMAGRFAEAIRETITDPELKNMQPLIGSIDQWADNTDLLSNTQVYTQLKGIYGELG